MGLELLFRPRGRKAPAERTFLRHFEGRANFERDGRHLAFRDGDTGAHFEFYLGDFRDDRAAGPLGRPYASFYMNHLRPGWRPYQAIPEIEALCAAFDLSCEHVDSEPGKAVAFDGEALFYEWTDGNEQCLRCMIMLEETQGTGNADETSPPDDHYPQEPLWNYWKWNWAREEARETEDGPFLAPVCFVRRGGTVESAIVWPDLIPMVFPRVDLVLFLPDSSRVTNRDLPEAFRLAEFGAVASLIAPYRVTGEPIEEMYAVNDEAPPAALADLVRRLPPSRPGALDLVDPGLVLEREIVEAMRDAQRRGDEGDGRWKGVQTIVRRDMRH